MVDAQSSQHKAHTGYYDCDEEPLGLEEEAVVRKHLVLAQEIVVVPRAPEVEDAAHAHLYRKEEEGAVVAAADAVQDPRAVVVHLERALIACAAVVGAGGLPEVAGATDLSVPVDGVQGARSWSVDHRGLLDSN